MGSGWWVVGGGWWVVGIIGVGAGSLWNMGKPDFEDLIIYQSAEKLANEIWEIVKHWDHFTKDTMGKQIVRSADSVCVNIAERRGRYNFKDHQRFIKIARGSLYETLSWLRLAQSRQLIFQEQSRKLKLILVQLPPQLNAYLKSLNR